MIKNTTDKAATVDTEYHWINAKEYPPPPATISRILLTKGAVNDRPDQNLA